MSTSNPRGGRCRRSAPRFEAVYDRCMSRLVSVPEKTLEHWSSQYLTYRYRSKAALWWPANGEDVDVRWLPKTAGKAVQLELKTLTVAGRALQDVLIDLGQLWEYHQRPLGRQPFYAFPWPDWTGSLTEAAIADGRSVTELAFARSGAGWWFADWMVVLTSAQVARVLEADLKAHGGPWRGNKARLVRFDLSQPRNGVTWGPRAAPPDIIRWRDLWPELQRSGRPDWPQLIRVPTRLLGRSGRTYPYSLIADLLMQSSFTSDNADLATGEMTTLVADGEGGFRVELQPNRSGDQVTAGGAEDNENHRQLVFLDWRALSPG